jgi:hypothetical protein
LPQDLVQEILVRLPADEPVHLVRASLVCKAWRRVLSDRDCFLCHCHGFHGAPPLLGYIKNRYSDASTMKFVPATTSIPFPVRMPAVDYSCCVALDCRHGRVLIHFRDVSNRRLVVCDLITGSQQHLRLPSDRYPSYPSYNYTGAVLCAKDGCDHLDCHDGPFRVVFVETDPLSPIFACAYSYSSLTGAWSAPTPNQITDNSSYYPARSGRKPTVLIGDVIYFPFEYTTSILKYDLCTHRLSEINMPRSVYRVVLMKTEDGGLGLASLSGNDNCIHMWSRQDVTNDIDGWVKHKVMKLGTLLPSRVPYKSYQVVGFAEGTNTIFVNISTEIFTLDLKSKKVRKVGEREGEWFDLILPYTSFYTPRYI